VALAVAVPLAAAIPATLVLWSGQDHSVRPAPTAPAIPLFDRVSDATIYYTVDPTPVTTPTASVLEFLMESAPGQSVTSSQTDVLQRVAPPSCHVPPLCQLRNVSDFAFQARRPGTAVLTFHVGGCDAGCHDTVVRKTVNVVLLPQVARGRLAG
jgi:hypothetical protein